MPTIVRLLGPEDTLCGDDWVRPLVEQAGASDINSFSTCSGTPLNHLKWVRAKDIIGGCWLGMSVKDIDKAWSEQGGFKYEVVRGNIPASHAWD